MSDRILIRNQYIRQKRNTRQNFRNSKSVIPVVGDDQIYDIPNFRGLFSKGFVGHTGPNQIIIGPNPELYSKFIDGIKNRDQSKITEVSTICERLVDAHCLFDIELEGEYKTSFSILPAPSITSAQAAVELLEVYAMALVRSFQFHLFDNISPFVHQFPAEAFDILDKICIDLNNANPNNVLKVRYGGNNFITIYLNFYIMRLRLEIINSNKNMLC